MHTYAAFLGHQPAISIAELAVTAPHFRFLRMCAGSVALFESDALLDQRYLNSLGGTIVLAQGLEKMPQDLADIPESLTEQLVEMKGKITFSLRAPGMHPKELGKLYRECKARLKALGHPSRYVGNDRTPAPSVVLHQNGLLDGSEGCEFVILQAKDFFWVGRTTGAQDIDSYTMRDTEKPVRDTRVGLLPPKLAQVLLNFGLWLAPAPASPSAPAKAKKGGKKGAPEPIMPVAYTVFDPFCGTGVIPMEALLRGYSVLASDKSEKAVTGCQKNLDWLRRKKDIKKSEIPSMVWRQDATKPFDFKKVKIPSLPQVIVTETSLGPALKDRPTVKESQTMRSENEDLQIGFLKAVAESLPGVPVVCTWPVWYSTKDPLWLERAWKAIDKAGFEAVLPSGVQSTTGRASLLYRRPDQLVGREIILLRPRKK